MGTPNWWRCLTWSRARSRILAGADGGDRDTGQREVTRPFGVGAHPGGVGHPDGVERDIGDVEHRIEDRAAAADGDGGIDDEYTGVGDHREAVGAVAVEYVPRGPVEYPAFGVADGADPVVDRRTRLLRIEPAGGERRVLRHRREERRRVGGAPHLLAHDRQLDGVLRIGQLRPARVDVALPQRRRIDPVLGDFADQRGRALFGDRVTHVSCHSR